MVMIESISHLQAVTANLITRQKDRLFVMRIKILFVTLAVGSGLLYKA